MTKLTLQGVVLTFAITTQSRSCFERMESTSYHCKDTSGAGRALPLGKGGLASHSGEAQRRCHHRPSFWEASKDGKSVYIERTVVIRQGGHRGQV